MKKLQILLLMLVVAAALFTGCAKKDTETPAETIQKSTSTAEKNQSETTEKASEHKAELNYDYANTIGDAGEYVMDIFGEPDDQKKDKNKLTLTYKSEEGNAVFHIALIEEDIDTEEEDEEFESPEYPDEAEDDVEGGPGSQNGPEETEEENCYQEVYRADTTAGKLFMLEDESIDAVDLLKTLEAERVKKSEDGKKLFFLSDGYCFAVEMTEPGKIKKSDGATIISEEYSDEIQ